MTRALFLALALALAPSVGAQSMQTDASPVGGSLLPGDGTIDASVQVRSTTEVPVDNCYGYVDPSAPDVVVEWDGGDLEISVIGSFDPTLAVYGPNGQWTCDDDTNNLLPVIRLTNAPAGRYAVWVGSFSPGAEETATVVAGVQPPRPALDASASALAGTVQATQGFEAQGAIEVAIRAGGRNPVQETDLGGPVAEGDFCRGFIDAAHPTVTVAYDGTGDLGLSATTPDTDLVMVVQAPDGTIRCNDDFDSTDPAIGFSPAESGDYAIWVGTFRLQDDTVGATLAVSEEAPTFEDFFGDDMIDESGFGAYSPGTYVLLDMDATPASRVRADEDGGASAEISIQPSVQNPVQGSSCRGYLELAPTAAIDLSGDGPFALTASSDDDLTLTVRTPSGDWFCSDDADGLDPGIQIDSVESGTYLAWVGSFGEREEAVSGTVSAMPGELTVSQSSFGGVGYDGPTQSDAMYDGDALGGAATTAVTFDGTRIQEEVGAGGAMLNPVEGETCGGFLSAQPTLAVQAEGMVQISADSADQDLTLTIQAPDGSWTCSDDADGTNPSALVDGGEGVYSVWVGTYYRRTEPIPATVTVEEGMIEEIELDMMDMPPPPDVIRG